MTNPDLKPIELSTDTKPEAILDPFAPENLRLNQSFTEMVGVKKVLTTIPVRKPNSQEFVRVHSDPNFRANVPLIELKDEREQYIVAAPLVSELWGEIVCVTLFVAVNRQGVVFLWPVRLPGPDGKDLDWWRSSREAAERAMHNWVRIKANLSLGAYELFIAQNNLGEPEWPELEYWALTKLAFQDRLINSLDHPVIKRLRGLS